MALRMASRRAAGQLRYCPAFFSSNRLFQSSGPDAQQGAPKPVPMSKLKDSFLDGTSSTYLEDMEEKYRQDPNSVDKSWASFFRSLGTHILRLYYLNMHVALGLSIDSRACGSAGDIRCRNSDLDTCFVISLTIQALQNLVSHLRQLQRHTTNSSREAKSSHSRQQPCPTRAYRSLCVYCSLLGHTR